MSQYQDSVKLLRAKGYRVTRQRKQVLKVLEQVQRPVSPYEIQRILGEEGEQINHVTIYRVLNLFCLLNLAHRVLLGGGFVRCTLGDKEGCHRFMLCHQCGTLREFADKSLCEAEDKLAHGLGFNAEQHFSEFFGLCSSCRR